MGPYCDPSDNVVVPCVEERTQIQTLERTLSILPSRLGCVVGVSHDYILHGTTTLLAALDIANGQVIALCRHRHRHQECPSFVKRVDAAVPADFHAHLVVDNYPTREHSKVRAWLAARPRFHVDYTPTYSS